MRGDCSIRVFAGLFIKVLKPVNSRLCTQNYVINKNPIKLTGFFIHSVREKGLEPPRLAAPDPKSGAATNYATRALGFFMSWQR